MIFNHFKLASRQGFGIIEVLAAALVLGFLIVGLTQLQMGNREAVLRIRARDVAQNLATDVIDSLRRVGLSSVISSAGANTDTIVLEKNRTFDGAVGQSQINYIIRVILSEDEDGTYQSAEQSGLTRAKISASSTGAAANELEYSYAIRVDVSVGWNFKGTDQSIQISEVIR